MPKKLPTKEEFVSMALSLTPEQQREFVERVVAEAGYATVSEYCDAKGLTLPELFKTVH